MGKKSKSIGAGDPNIPGWIHIRKAILEMDDYMCRICFADSHIAQMHVHHIDYDRTNNKHSNLVTLCSVCHKAVHMENYKPFEHDDWPTPWNITRPEEE